MRRRRIGSCDSTAHCLLTYNRTICQKLALDPSCEVSHVVSSIVPLPGICMIILGGDDSAWAQRGRAGGGGAGVEAAAGGRPGGGGGGADGQQWEEG